MNAKLLSAALLCLSFAIPMRAQFFTLGSDPAYLRWSSINTPTYKVIYPRGLDSLARTYALTLEREVAPAGFSVGFKPNDSYRKRMPVVLHSHSAYSNGQVTWTPRRMDLLTVPDAFAPEATPWVRQLVVHESRHVAQMQFSSAKPFRAFNYLTGQLLAGGLAAVYCGPAFFEGDAVAAETALTSVGRGRTADFLEYWRAASIEGDTRDYWQWRYGSQRYYTPDYYRAGYVMMAGMRTLYDAPDFTAKYFKRIADHHGIAFFNFQKTVKEVSGKSLDAAFAEVCDSLQGQWAADDLRRAPYMYCTQTVPSPRRYTEYTDLEMAGNRLIAVRSGITRPTELVEVGSDGKVKYLTSFAKIHSSPRYSKVTDRFYWSELSSSGRWEMASFSNISFSDKKGKLSNLTRRTRFFHPSPSPVDTLLSATEYPVEGGSNVVILSSLGGQVLKRYHAPDNLQVVETAWVEDEVFASVIGEDGFGICRVGSFDTVLDMQAVKIKQLHSGNGRLLFTCDRTGVNEVYSLDPSDGSLVQLTSTRLGASDFTFDASGDTLYYASPGRDGRLVFKTPTDSLPARPVDLAVLATYPFAEELARQEEVKYDESLPVEIGEPQRYSRLSNLFRVHSWIPAYFNYDETSSMSLETIGSYAGLGATVFSQNDLGNAYGFAGYHFNPATGRHSGHASFTYAGLLPVIEVSGGINERAAYTYTEKTNVNGNPFIKAVANDKLSLSATIDTYIPLKSSLGGWSIGVIPQASLTVSNDDFAAFSASMSRLIVNLRGYAMQSIPSSRILPRFGIGVNLGYVARPWSQGFVCPDQFVHLYGYVPGFWETHGFKLAVLYEQRLTGGRFVDPYVKIAPRGYGYRADKYLAAFTDKVKLSWDYAMPIAPVDWSWLSPVAYIRNFELIPHGDWTGFYSYSLGSGNLYSVGLDFIVRLGNLLWIPYDTRLGISYDYNGGSYYSKLEADGSVNSPHSLSLVFTIDI